MPKRKLLEQHKASDRARERQKLGTLRELTVQPATRKRYQRATQAFFDFLHQEQLEISRKRDQFDIVVCEFLEHLWSTGVGRGQANDTVAGLQDLQPSLRNHLPGAWRLLKTWAVNEVPSRAPPLPELVVHAMAGCELLGLKSSSLLCAPKDRQVLISLSLTKSGKRQGAAESVILGVEEGVRLVQHWKQIAKVATPLASSPVRWRTLFTQSLASLGLESFQFRPYSLRRGGATWWFQKHQNLDRILVQGRWLAHKTARIYINEGLAMLTKTQIDFNSPTMRSFLHIYRNTVRTPRFSTLEPPANAGSTGGRGKKGSKRVRKRVQNAFWLLPGRATLFFGVARNPEVWLDSIARKINLSSDTSGLAGCSEMACLRVDG